MQATNRIYALDIGETRTGVASAHTAVGIASPHSTIVATPQELPQAVQKLLSNDPADTLVVGLPRGLNGQETAQTKHVQSQITAIQKLVSIPIHEQDEALTSRKAEEELQARGKPYQKGDIDALAATYILQDFLDSHPELRG
jgi:putative Holliday junction resolvase